MLSTHLPNAHPEFWYFPIEHGVLPLDLAPWKAILAKDPQGQSMIEKYIETSDEQKLDIICEKIRWVPTCPACFFAYARAFNLFSSDHTYVSNIGIIV